jgi:hypothetical protein
MSPPREPALRDGGSADHGEVQVWRGADRYWRYRFVHAPKAGVITSNRSHLTRDQAVESARMAYPGVRVVELGAPPEGERRRRSGWRGAAIKLSGVALFALVVRTIFRSVRGIRRAARRARTVTRWAGFAASLARKDPPSPDHTSR